MKTFIFFICLILSISCNSQILEKNNYRADTINTLQKILREGKVISTQGIGNAGKASRQWYCFAFLLSLIDTHELLEMTKDASACVRLYSFIGLTHFKNPKVLEIKNTLLKDRDSLRSISGCFVSTITVSEGIKDLNYWYAEIPLTNFLKAIQTNKTNRDKLYEDIVLNRPISFNR